MYEIVKSKVEIMSKLCPDVQLREMVVPLLRSLGVARVGIVSVFDEISDLQEARRSNIEWYLLFDISRIFVYHHDQHRSDISIESVVKTIVDGYDRTVYEPLRNSVRDKGFKFIVGEKHRLDVPYDLATVPISHVLTVDLIAGSIKCALTSAHPEVHASRWAGKRRLQLRSRKVSSGLRAMTLEEDFLSDLVSPDVGIIREEKLLLSSVLPAAVATVASGGRDGKFFLCGGKSLLPVRARAIARCEAVERYHTRFQSRRCRLVYGSYVHMQEEAIDPIALMYQGTRTDPSEERKPYTPDTAMYWTSAYDVYRDRTVLVPAQEVWFNTTRNPKEHLIVRNTTNACALGASIEEAALFALFEAVERDAFLMMWYLRRPCSSIGLESIESETVRLLWLKLRLDYPNYEVIVFDISTDVRIPTIGGTATRKYGSGGKVFVAASAHLSVYAALESVLKDLAISLAGQIETRDHKAAVRLLEAPQTVSSPEDHRALYSLDETFDRLSFLYERSSLPVPVKDLTQNIWIAEEDSYDLRVVLRTLAEKMAGDGLRLLIVDITHPTLLDRGVRCAKAVVPGLYPMWFGYKGMRFAMTERLLRLARQWNVVVTTQEDVNLEIHPFD
jgi:thiazole/oxazole-forming peptide maturase SagD family component